MITPKILSDDVLLEDVITAALESGMHIITNGRRAAISPIIPQGWSKVGIKVVNRHRARLEAQQCAA